MVQTSCNCFKMVFNNLILLATFLAFSSCGQGERLNTDTGLERKIEEEVTSGQNILDLGRITNRDWDSLLILTPYTTLTRWKSNWELVSRERSIRGLSHETI